MSAEIQTMWLTLTVSRRKPSPNHAETVRSVLNPCCIPKRALIAKITFPFTRPKTKSKRKPVSYPGDKTWKGQEIQLSAPPQCRVNWGIFNGRSRACCGPPNSWSVRWCTSLSRCTQEATTIAREVAKARANDWRRLQHFSAYLTTAVVQSELAGTSAKRNLQNGFNQFTQQSATAHGYHGFMFVSFGAKILSKCPRCII